MSEFLDNVSLIGDALFDIMTQIFSLYTSTVILGAVFGLWVLRKIVDLFRYLR